MDGFLLRTYTIAGSVSVGAAGGRPIVRPLASDLAFGGPGVLSGTLKVFAAPSNTPIKRVVRLFADQGALCIRQTESNPATGAWSFDNLRLGIRFTVIGYDFLHDYRAVIADNASAL